VFWYDSLILALIVRSDPSDQSVYIDLVTSTKRPRSWEFEGLFLDIRERFPGMPEPKCECLYVWPFPCHDLITGRSVPETGDLPTVDAVGSVLASESARFQSNLSVCKDIIRKSPRQVPPPLAKQPERPITPDGGLSISSMIQYTEVLLTDAYSQAEKPDFAPYALRLITPYLLDGKFAEAYDRVLDAQDWAHIEENVPTLDLLLEAHELTLPDSGRLDEPPKLEKGSRLQDVLQRRKAYLPITKAQSFFIFGRRIDFATNFKSYSAVWEQLGVGSDRQWDLKVTKAILHLVSCMITHLDNV